MYHPPKVKLPELLHAWGNSGIGQPPSFKPTSSCKILMGPRQAFSLLPYRSFAIKKTGGWSKKVTGITPRYPIYFEQSKDKLQVDLNNHILMLRSQEGHNSFSQATTILSKSIFWNFFLLNLNLENACSTIKLLLMKNAFQVAGRVQSGRLFIIIIAF